MIDLYFSFIGNWIDVEGVKTILKIRDVEYIFSNILEIIEDTVFV